MPGGGDSGGGDSRQEVIPWSGAQGDLHSIFGAARDIYNAGDPGFYPGQTFAPRDPLSDQAQNLRLNYATNSMPGQVYDAQRAHSFALNSPDAANNPYVQGMMQTNQNMVNRNLQENLLPSIRGGAMSAGQVGGSRQGVAEGIALRGTSEALSNANNQLMLDAYGKGLGSQGMALANAGQNMSLGMAPMDVMSQTGAYNQGIDSQALQSDMDRWNANRYAEWDWLQPYNATISGNNQWGADITADGGGSSPIAGALGGGLLGYSAASSIPALSGTTALGLGPAGLGLVGASALLGGWL